MFQKSHCYLHVLIFFFFLLLYFILLYYIQELKVLVDQKYNFFWHKCSLMAHSGSLGKNLFCLWKQFIYFIFPFFFGGGGGGEGGLSDGQTLHDLLYLKMEIYMLPKSLHFQVYIFHLHLILEMWLNKFFFLFQVLFFFGKHKLNAGIFRVVKNRNKWKSEKNYGEENVMLGRKGDE